MLTTSTVTQLRCFRPGSSAYQVLPRWVTVSSTSPRESCVIYHDGGTPFPVRSSRQPDVVPQARQMTLSYQDVKTANGKSGFGTRTGILRARGHICLLLQQAFLFGDPELRILGVSLTLCDYGRVGGTCLRRLCRATACRAVLR